MDIFWDFMKHGTSHITQSYVIPHQFSVILTNNYCPFSILWYWRAICFPLPRPAPLRRAHDGDVGHRQPWECGVPSHGGQRRGLPPWPACPHACCWMDHGSGQCGKCTWGLTSFCPGRSCNDKANVSLLLLFCTTTWQMLFCLPALLVGLNTNTFIFQQWCSLKHEAVPCLFS